MIEKFRLGIFTIQMNYNWLDPKIIQSICLESSSITKPQK